MATAPLTRFTRWFEPRLLGFLERNGFALAIAVSVMAGGGDRHLGPWNLAIFAAAFGLAKLALSDRGRTAIGRVAERAFDALWSWQRKRTLAKGPGAWVAAFPKVHDDSKSHMLGHVTLRDGDGEVLYQLRITAEPGQFGHDGERYTIRGFLGITNLVEPERSRVERAEFTVVDGRIGAEIGILDEHAPRIGGKMFTIDLTQFQTEVQSYTVGAKGAAPRQAALADDAVGAAVAAIGDEGVRREAAVIALEIESALDAELGALRRRAGRLLHPDACKAPGAAAALSAINARIDALEARAAA